MDLGRNKGLQAAQRSEFNWDSAWHSVAGSRPPISRAHDRNATSPHTPSGSGEPDRRGAGDGVVAPGRSTTDLLATLKELEACRVSVIALNGMAFYLATPHGRVIATMLAGIAGSERELIQDRIRSGIAAAKARGKRPGRQPGQRPKSDRLAPKVLALIDQRRSDRLIGREVGLSKNTVAPSVKRNPGEVEPVQ